METEIIKIDKLQDVSQWMTWRFQVKVCLNAGGNFGVTSGTEKLPVAATGDPKTAAIAEWKLKDAKAQRVIVTSMGQKPLQHILQCETSAEMWTKLHAVYDQKHEAGKQMLMEKFYSYKCSSSDDMATHVSKLEYLAQQIRDAGDEISEDILKSRIISSLPNEYAHFSSAWDSTATAERTLVKLTQRLMVEEHRVNSRKAERGESSSKTQAFLAKKGGGNFKGKSSDQQKKSQSKQKGKCYKCGSDQHYKRNCPELKQSTGKKSNNENDPETKAFLCDVSESILKQQQKDSWFVDSGATAHMCNRIDWLEDYEELQEKIPVTIGDGSKMYGIGRGNLNALTYTGEEWIEKQLKNVVYVPDGYVNLFSSSKALDNGHTLRADADTFKFYDDDKVVAVAMRRGGLWQMMIQPIECENLAAHVAVKTMTLQMWHERLGHQHNAYVRKFLRNRNIEFIDENFDCDGCAYGKQHRLSFESRTEKSTACGEIIHGDLWGPYDKSIGGSIYFVVFKDDFSHMRFVYCLKNKTEVAEKLKSFITFSEKQYGHKIKAFQSDQGTECDNVDVNNFLEENGIQHRRSVVYTPEQNGSAEREMRTIVESARSMIHAKGLNDNLWAEAVNLAVYVLNRSGTSTVKGKTPYELWRGKPASIEHLRAFGTGVYVHIPKQKRRKLDPKSKKCIFVGFDDNIKGYRVYDPDTRSIEVVRDVKFLSDEFNTIKIIAQVHGGQEKSVQTDDPTEVEAASQSDDDEDAGTSDSSVQQSSKQVPAKIVKRRGTSLADIDENNILNTRLRNRRDSENALVAMALIAVGDEPQTYQEAIESPDSKKWKHAMQEEYDSLQQNHTWELVDKPHDQKVIDNKWVFKIKNNPDDSIERYKARLVARGFNQQHGIDYEETFSPVVRYDSIRTLFAIAAAKKLKMRQFDVKTAFLYGDLQENVYMKQPIGFSDGTNKVCKLRKSLYGLKQSSRCWNQKFKNFIEEFGFKSSKADPCVFAKTDEKNTVILCIYVDDGMIFGDSDDIINQIIGHLKQKFEIKVVNAGCFLGIEIDRLSDGSIFIHQKAYARKVIRKFNMESCAPVGVPSDTNQKLLQNDDSEPSNFPYRQLIGSVMYLAMGTRPDISYAVGVASRYLEKPSSTHVGAAKRILRYINGTLNRGILYHHSMGEISFNGYSDSDYAGDLDTRKSTTGFVFTVNGSAITWCSRRQSSVSKSTTEAEYIAASEATSELIWLKRLLNEVVPNQFNKPTLYIDNESATKLVKNPVFHRRTKHIDVAYHFIREQHERDELAVESISTHDQLADGLTKALPKSRFEFLWQSLSMIN